MFNIRVYGILINDQRQVLVSDELIRGMRITKFCGGGLEKGEGTRECLVREFMEEMNLRVTVTEHIYTTDFYQQSAFKPDQQIVSVYYAVQPLEPITVPLRNKPFEFDEEELKEYATTGETETFRFVDWDDFNENSVSLPIDKLVAKIIKENTVTPLFDFEELENERVRLEPLRESHYADLLPVAMHLELWKYTAASIKNENDFRIYFDQAMKEKSEAKAFPFVVYDKLNKCYAGSTRFASISKENKRLEIGWTWYAPALQGSGINKACKLLLFTNGFEKLDLNRIELKTSIYNLRSQKAMERLGALKEGIFRRHIVNADGTLRDTVYYSFIKEEWENIKVKYFT